MQEEKKSTGERILDAAEALFDQNGLYATSTRQIAEKAGANSAAPNFHFGTKSKLIQEVFRRRMKPLVERRLELLRLATDKSEPPEVGAIIDSFFDPLVELRRDPDENKQTFLRLLARTTVAPCKEFTELLETEFEDYIALYGRALGRALPHLSAEEIGVRFDLAIGVFARAHSHLGWPVDADEVDRATRQFVLAGLVAKSNRTESKTVEKELV